MLPTSLPHCPFSLSLSGWFCGALPSVCEFVSVEVLQERPSAAADGAAAEDAAAGEQQQLEWRPLQLPRGVKALVLVNLQSYGGGRDIWGATPSKHRSWRTPSVSDGAIEARSHKCPVRPGLRASL